MYHGVAPHAPSTNWDEDGKRRTHPSVITKPNPTPTAARTRITDLIQHSRDVGGLWAVQPLVQLPRQMRWPGTRVFYRFFTERISYGCQKSRNVFFFLRVDIVIRFLTIVSIPHDSIVLSCCSILFVVGGGTDWVISVFR